MSKRKELVPLSPDDRSFFEEFYQEHKRFMYYTATKYTRSISESEDLVQESIVRLLNNISTLQEIRGYKIQKYIALTVKAAFIDMERKRRREEPIHLDDETVEFLYRSDYISAPEIPDVDPKLKIEQLKSDLPYREWLLLEGKYILGYTQDELGYLIGVAPDSVRMILCRTREKARKILNCRKKQGGPINE